MESKRNLFLDRINKMHDAEDMESERKASEKLLAEQKAAAEQEQGPGIAHSNMESISRGISEAISQTRRDFQIARHSQKNADIEIVINKKWLLTVTLKGVELEIYLYNLLAQNNPRLRSESDHLDFQAYKLVLSKGNEWNWLSQRRPGRTITQNPKRIFSVGNSPSLTSIHTRDMEQHILAHCVDVLEWSKDEATD